MARTGAVAVVVLGSLLALMQFEAALANPVSANVQSTGFVGGSSSGAAQSQIVENDGTIKGECAYVGPDGNTIKVGTGVFGHRIHKRFGVLEYTFDKSFLGVVDIFLGSFKTRGGSLTPPLDHDPENTRMRTFGNT